MIVWQLSQIVHGKAWSTDEVLLGPGGAKGHQGYDQQGLSELGRWLRKRVFGAENRTQDFAHKRLTPLAPEVFSLSK